MGNAMVTGKPASVILNEVNSPNPSQLMGMVEVAGKNSFTTGGQLTTSDINNQANYQADSVGVNIGVGVSPTGKYVPGGTSAGIGSDSGKSSSITRAGISDIAGDKDARADTNQANTSVALAMTVDSWRADWVRCGGRPITGTSRCWLQQRLFSV
jgi:hypothetical protein